MTYFTGGKKELCVSVFDLIDGVGLHAQIRRCWSGLGSARERAVLS